MSRCSTSAARSPRRSRPAARRRRRSRRRRSGRRSARPASARSASRAPGRVGGTSCDAAASSPQATARARSAFRRLRERSATAPAGPNEEDRDQERRVGRHALPVAGRTRQRSPRRARQRRRPPRRRAPARQPIPTGASATIRLLRDADRRDEHLAGERGALASSAGPVFGPVERHGEIRADDRARRVARRQVDGGRRVDRDDRAPSPCARRGRPRPRSGSGRAARPGRRSRAAHRPRSTASLDVLREHLRSQRDRAWMRLTPRSLSSRFQLRVASAVAGRAARRDEHHRDLGALLREVARRDEPVAAVVAGPAQEQDRALASSGRSARRSP